MAALAARHSLLWFSAVCTQHGNPFSQDNWSHNHFEEVSPTKWTLVRAVINRKLLPRCFSLLCSLSGSAPLGPTVKLELHQSQALLPTVTHSRITKTHQGETDRKGVGEGTWSVSVWERGIYSTQTTIWQKHLPDHGHKPKHCIYSGQRGRGQWGA